MTDIGSLVMSVLSCLKDPTSDLYSSIKHYDTKLITLEEKAQTLTARHLDYSKAINTATHSRDETIKQEVTDWMHRAERLKLDFDHFSTSSRTNLTCCFGSVPNCRRRSRLNDQAVSLLGRIEAVLAEPLFQAVSFPRSPPRTRIWTDAAKKRFELFDSTKSALERVLTALRDNEVRAVGVHGMGGVGKTTMLKETADRAVASGLFDVAVFVTMSKDPNVEKIQTRIAEFLSLTLGPGLSVKRRAELIMHRILRNKRFLFILDDLWHELELEDFGIPCDVDLDSCASKILIAARNENICHRMDCKEKVRLDVWSELESWDFFKKVAKTDFDSPEFEKVGRMVARECGGLPLSLVAVAKAVGDKDKREWEKALVRLQKSRSPNPDDDMSVSGSLKVSYDFLKREERECFLLCSLFPEDHNIGYEEIARYAFGLGFLREADTMMEARDDAGSIVLKLIESGMLLDGDKAEQVKMHDVFRDFAILLTSESEMGQEVFKVQTGGKASKEWPDRSEIYTAISLVSNKIIRLPDSPNGPKLHTLLLQETKSLKEIPNEYFEKINGLKVLDLSGTEAPSLPISTKLLEKLQTLHLDLCKFADVSVLGGLENLTILSFRKSNIVQLPEDLGKLRNLRVLDLTLSSNIIRIPPKLISNLGRLEELYLKASFAEWRNEMYPETSQNASFTELTGLNRLTILNVDIDYVNCLPQDVAIVQDWVKFNICLCRDRFVRLMTVHSKQAGVSSRSLLLDTSTKSLPGWFNTNVSKKTETLKYSGCTGLNMVEDDLCGFLSELKYLVVEQCANVYHLLRPMNNSSNSHPVLQSLQELRIHQMDFMKGICEGELPIGSLENLRFLEIQQCKELAGSLLTPNLIKRLSNLQRIRASGNFVTDVFGFENIEEDKYLGRLNEIWLENLRNLKVMLKGPARLADFTKLKLVSVVKCNRLKSIFSVSESEGLSELEELWIEKCQKMEDIIRNEVGVRLDKVRLPKLKTLCVKNLPTLSSFCTGIASFECPSMEYLHIDNCSNFQTPISDFQSANTVKLNDQQHMDILIKRMKEPGY